MISTLDEVVAQAVLAFEALEGPLPAGPALRASVREHLASKWSDVDASLVDHATQLVIDDLVGFGALERVCRDPMVTVVLVGDDGVVSVVRHGRHVVTNVSFRDAETLRTVLARLEATTRRGIAFTRMQARGLCALVILGEQRELA